MGSMDIERTDMKRRHSEAQLGPMAGPQRVPAPVMRDFDHVRNNVRKHARGLFSTPHQRQSSTTGLVSDIPELPPRADYAHLSRSYLDCIHEWYPLLQWPTFQHQVDEVYASRSLEGSSREWIGLFFAVLACGSLQAVAHADSTSQANSAGVAYFDIASKMLTPWLDHVALTHVQAALLMSIFAGEQSMKSAGSMWLASAVRAAQELQICPEIDHWSVVDGETRRRIWWAIYVRDR